MASPLKKWLRSQDVYDKDLETILLEQGIKDPECDFKTYTQPQWDELWRKMVVERAKDLKDQASKVRLEKKMKKVEKHWRKESGIKQTSIQKGKTKKKKTNNKDNSLESAKELKKFLQKNNCFDKDLLSVLAEMAILTEADLSKIDGNAKFDEIYRKIRVLRAKELKDNAARVRMEKNMTKFEKLWRKQTNIKKKSSMTNNSDKNSKNPKTKKNEELSGKGKELKDWMKKNEVWETSLYDELLANNINNEDQLSGLTEKKFDVIVRKVRVDRFSQLKDQKSRNRADKLLITFEKAWRKASGVKKTSIQKKKNADTADTADDGKDSTSDDKPKPFYLSGKSSMKSNNMPAKARSTYDKKKDARISAKLKEAEAVEQEWLEIYSRAMYGDYKAPPIDEYANLSAKEIENLKKKKEKEKENDDGGDEKEKDDDDPVPNLYTIDVDYGDMVLDICMSMLLTLHESWEGRTAILNELVDQLCDKNISNDIYALKLCKFLRPVGHQFTDPRSLIIQEMNEVISRLARNTSDKFIIFVPYILRQVFQTFHVRIEALREPGLALGHTLIQVMTKDDTNHVILNEVINGLESKHGAVRSECVDYLDYLLRGIGLLEKDDASELEQELLKLIDGAVVKSCKDANAEARMNGYRALTVYKEISPTSAQAIIDKMTKAQSGKYDEANLNPHWK